MSIEVKVDPTNPGQYFGCCGLLELATRLDAAARAYFAADCFHIDTTLSLPTLLAAFTATPLQQLDAEDTTASPIHVPLPFDLRLDWWKDAETGGRDLKVWAGTMQSVRIGQAMLAALRDVQLHDARLFDHGFVVPDPDDTAKKVEPFYFDSRRAPNAHSRDVGFSPNDLDLATTAFPATELMCLVGLQRCRPAKTRRRRIFEYRTWSHPLPLMLVPAIVSGHVPTIGATTYQFECWYRTGQKKHKAFRPAVLVGQGEG